MYGRVLATVAMIGTCLVTSCSAEPTADGASPSPSAEVPVPDTVVGEQIRWTLDQLAADSGPDPAEAEARFADVFLAEIGPDELSGVFDSLRALGPWRLTGVTGETHAAEAGLRNGDDAPWVMTIAADPDGRINTLVFAPDPVADRTPAASYEALIDELAGLAPQAGFLAARVDGDRCQPVAERDSGESLPLGSAAKLYVLGALADAVIGGALSWQDTVTVTDELRSLPTGELQDAPAGTGVTLRDAAQGMIAISDNTATDLVIDRLGREQVQAAPGIMGHADPDRNVPFLTTRELFQLGWGDPQWREQWVRADQPGRAALVTDLSREPLDVAPASITTPAWPDEVDWFGSPQDVCAAHLALQARAGDAPEVREILSANPGIAFDTATWPYVAFKGGSAPGVLAGSWYAEHTDGSAVVVVFQLAASDPPIDQRYAFTAVADAFWLLADAAPPT